MTVTDLKNALNLTPVSLPEGDREAEGVYIGDLLSWVMGRAQADNVSAVVKPHSRARALKSVIILPPIRQTS
ncbi:MAG: hypothetical protein J6P94_03005 [Oscillospiraceae bacterium]|nr:hypothetical protein [Oscillospiraceae bacterium]